MNRLKGKIKHVERSDNISLVIVDVMGQDITSIVLQGEKNPIYTVGQDVYVLFKETEVSIAKDFSGEISLRNRFHCKVKSIDTGKLLSRVNMRWNEEDISSIITTASVKRLSLKEGDEVLAFVKTNEISIMEL